MPLGPDDNVRRTGDVILGDMVFDLDSELNPKNDNTGEIGEPDRRWGKGHFVELRCQEIISQDLVMRRIIPGADPASWRWLEYSDRIVVKNEMTGRYY